MVFDPEPIESKNFKENVYSKDMVEQCINVVRIKEMIPK